MNLFKKAQTATEYLIILAVVIIIALIVVGVLGGIPGVGKGAGSRASAAYWQTADIAIPSYAIGDDSAADDLNLTVRNNLRNSITMTAFTLGGQNIFAGCTATSLSTGQQTTCNDEDIGAICSAAGDTYSLDISITYTDDPTGASFTFNGDGTKLEGVCAT